MMRQVRPLALLLATLLFAAGCAPAFQSQQPQVYQRYVNADPSKALAYVQGSNGAFAYGMSTGQATEQLAIDQALQQCETQSVAREVEGECVLRMVNSRSVDD